MSRCARLSSALLLCVLVLHALTSRGAVASTDFPAGGVLDSGPYCGLLCLYGALRLKGVDVSLSQFMEYKHVGPQGSSLVDLVEKADEYGLESFIWKNVGHHELQSMPKPLILHALSDDKRFESDHYVLLIDSASGTATVWSPPSDFTTISIGELASIHSGVVLAVSARGDPAPRVSAGLRAHQLGRHGLVLALFLCLLMALSRLVGSLIRRINRGASVGVALEMLALAVGASAVGLGSQWYRADGLWKHDATLQKLCLKNVSELTPVVSTESAAKAHSEGAVVLDMRREQDYALGHIPGAIHVEPFSQSRLDATMASVGRDREIVVYCQSAQCDYATWGLKALRGLGYRNVHYYKGGWNEFTRAQREDSL